MKRPLVGITIALGFWLSLSLLSYSFLGWWGVLVAALIGGAVGWVYGTRR